MHGLDVSWIGKGNIQALVNSCHISMVRYGEFFSFKSANIIATLELGFLEGKEAERKISTYVCA